MNEPKRWAEASSEVDPVVRSLLRHAQSRGPSELEVTRLVARVEAASSPSVLRAARRRKVGRAAAWLAVAALSSVVGAVVGPRLGVRAPFSSDEEPKRVPHSERPAAASTPEAPREREPSVVPPSSAASPPSALRAPPSAPSETHVIAPAIRPEAHRPAPLPAPSSAAVDASADLESLTEARRVLASDPAHALALTEASQRDNPGSPFAEERAALAVEALLRLGRNDEAKRRLNRFEQAFPSSPYRRRLNAWLTARTGGGESAADAP